MLHGLLFLTAVCGAVDLVNFARVEVPNVEEAAATGSVDLISIGERKCRDAYWGLAEVERCKERIGRRRIGGDVVEEES